MKLIHALVFIMLIFIAKADYTITKCEDYRPSKLGGSKQAYSLDLCRSSSYDDTKYAKCCFLKWEDADEKRQYNCLLVTPTEYANIDDYEDKIEKELGGEIDSIDCKSSYLYGSIFLMLALLF